MLNGLVRRTLTTTCAKKSSYINEMIQVVKTASKEDKITIFPSSFVVPKHIKYPEHLHGKKLAISELRRQYKQNKLTQAQVDDLDAVAFVWDVNAFKSTQRLQAIKTYYELHGHVSIPRAFVVPATSAWPEPTWSLPLGSIVHRMRSGLIQLEAEEERSLDDIGFVLNVHQEKWTAHLHAFETFQQMYHHGHVPVRFVVPCDRAWPECTHGLKLGRIVSRWRGLEMDSERRAALDELGFVWRPLEEKWTIKLMALSAYQHIYGDTLVPKLYVVGSNDTRYPEECWGMKLGTVVNSIRTRMDEMPREHRDSLDQLGFIWDPLEHQWDLVVLALRTYLNVHGHLRISTSYVIPMEDEDWPEELWGLRLGSLVTQIRHRADIMATEQAELLATIVLTEEQDDDADNSD